MEINNEKIKRKIKQYFGVTIGVIILDIAFYFFMDPASIVTGGMLGVSILLGPVFEQIGSWFTASTFLYLANGITLILGVIFLGKDFFFKTIYGTFLSPTIVLLFEKFCDPSFFIKTITGGNEKIIAMICGSILCGVGVGIAIRNNGSTGGMDVIQKIMSKYMKVPMSISMYFTDGIVVLLAGFLLTQIGDNELIRSYTINYQIENVIWGIIGVAVQAYIIDYICLSAKPRRTVYVITNKEEEIKNLIYEKLNRGVTLTKVTGGYTNEERTMLICTMDKNEAYRITSEITLCDPESFTFVTSCKEVRGEYSKRGIL
ncbi:MAG: YitT family protein [Anaeroplasma sp.]